MQDGDGGSVLPQMSELGMMQLLLSEDIERGNDEPPIAASIGEQMLHMDMTPLPRSIRCRIRDVCSRISTRNAILVGGGIGHLSAWLFDLWCPASSDGKPSKTKRPDTFRIIEPGNRFGVIIDRLIRRYGAESWSSVIALPWNEVAAEATPIMAANVAFPRKSRGVILPMPLDLVVIDLPEDERAATASSAFDLLSPGGLVLVQEPKVPTGDVGVTSKGEEPTPAQIKVESFNQWIKLVTDVNDNHSLGFAELTGGTLVALIKADS